MQAALRSSLLALVLWSAAGAAHADFYYAVAVGEKLFVAREDRGYRATRSAINQCVAEFDPLLCREVSLRQVDGRWQSEVVGQKGFFATDRKRTQRAERRALDACQGQSGLRNCRVRPAAQPATTPSSEPQPGNRLRLEDLLNR